MLEPGCGINVSTEEYMLEPGCGINVATEEYMLERGEDGDLSYSAKPCDSGSTLPELFCLLVPSLPTAQ